MPIDFTGDFLRASGRLDINVFGFVQGSVAFAFQQQTVDVNTGSGPVFSAKLTTLALNILGDDGNPANGAENGLWIGTPDRSIGFSVGSGSLAIATVKPTTTTDVRSWTAITAQIANGTFTGGGPLEATVNSLRVEINKATGTGAQALNWTSSIDTDGDHNNFSAKAVSISVETGGTPIVHQVTYAGERLRAAGSLTINILGFVSGTVGFSYETKTVDARVGSGDDLDNATLSLISLTVTNLFVGVPGGPGFTLSSGKLSLALLKPNATANDGRSWMALTATLGNASLTGIDGLTLSISSVTAKINRGAGTKTTGGAAADAINWATSIDTDAAGGFDVADPVEVVDEANVKTPINLSGSLLELGGTLTSLDVFGFVTGSGTLLFRQSEVTVTEPAMTKARLTTLTLTLSNVFVGIPNGPGFTLAGATLHVASLKPPAPAQPGGTPDPRSWTAVYVELNGASFSGVPGAFSLEVPLLKVKINQASGGAVPPAALDWSKVNATLPGDIATLKGKLLLATGSVNIKIADFVEVSGEFAFEKGDDIFITRAGVGETSRKVSLIRIGINAGTLFAGINATNPNERVGLLLSDVSLGLALMKDAPGVGTTSYTALIASGTAQLVGVDELNIFGTLRVELNQTSDTANPTKVVDFSKLPGGKLEVKTGPNESSPLIPLTFTTDVLRVAGKALLRVQSFVFVSADFAFEKIATPFTLTTDEGVSSKTGQVTAIKVGVTNGNAFFGTGGPYFNNDGTLHADAAGATGLLVSNLTVGLALIKPTAAAGNQLAQYKSFFALKASGNISLVGVDGVTASITNMSIEINDATRLGTGTPLAAADFSTNNLSIPTGIGTDPVVITAKGRLIRQGHCDAGLRRLHLRLRHDRLLEGPAATNMTLVGGAPAGTLDLITVEATGVNVFAGVDGPASAPGAKGLSIENVNLGLAILKPTAAVNRKSYFALSISAASASLIGIDGVTAKFTDIEVEINSASDPR